MRIVSFDLGTYLIFESNVFGQIELVAFVR